MASTVEQNEVRGWIGAGTGAGFHFLASLSRHFLANG